MYANYHTHTKRCGHAVGEEREYIENAIKAGMKELGFADHSPQVFGTGYVSGMRMKPEEAEGYFKTLGALREEYKNDIKIYIGFEAEYFPAIFDKLTALAHRFDCDYFIMGQHWPFNEDPAFDTSGSLGMEERISTYVSQVIKGLSTGKFTYLAHPDMMNYTGDEGVYHDEMTRLCKYVKSIGMPLEVNMLGFWDHRCYPSDRFFGIAAEVGCELIIGCDAHDPAALIDTETQNRCRAWAERFGLNILDRINLVKP